MIKKDLKKILFLDLDDCIIPWGNYRKSYGYDLESIKKETSQNVEILNRFCDLLGFEIYLTSSWSCILELKNNKLYLKESIKDSIEDEIKELFEIVKKLNINYIDEINNREKAIRNFMKNNKIEYGLIVDDFNLSFLEKEFDKLKYIEAKDIDPVNLLKKLILGSSEFLKKEIK